MSVHGPFVALADDPVGDTVHHPYSAYNQGHDAGMLGWPNDAMNPYPPDSREHRWWRMGFFDGAEPDDDVCSHGIGFDQPCGQCEPDIYIDGQP